MRIVATVLLLVYFMLSPFVVFAQEGSDSAALEPVSYDLPYPGILPDSPLYSLKMIRDRVVSMLLSDPVKKAEFNLLQADKRLQAGVYLLQKDPEEIELALTTIGKGQNYFFEALQNVNDAKKQGFYTGDVAHQLSLAARKHAEVIRELKKKVSPSEQKQVVVLEKQITEYAENANSLINK